MYVLIVTKPIPTSKGRVPATSFFNVTSAVPGEPRVEGLWHGVHPAWGRASDRPVQAYGAAAATRPILASRRGADAPGRSRPSIAAQAGAGSARPVRGPWSGGRARFRRRRRAGPGRTARPA